MMAPFTKRDDTMLAYAKIRNSKLIVYEVVSAIIGINLLVVTIVGMFISELNNNKNNYL